MTPNPLQELTEIMTLMRTDPVACANKLDQMADKLHALADRIRRGDGVRDIGGMGDRVQINLVGPDGTIKQRVDTGRR